MNTSAMNYQRSLVLGGFGIESVPASSWRDSVKAGEPVAYRHEISGNALVECEDGRQRIVHVETVLFGKKRHSALGGLVTTWEARPSKGKAHAQAKTVERNGETGFDGPSPVFTEADPIVAAQAERGLCYKASIAKGKTLGFTGVELKPKLHGDKRADGTANPNAGQQVVGKDGVAYYTLGHVEGTAVVDRPERQDLADDDVAPVSSETGTVRQAARRQSTPESAAGTETAQDGLFAGAL